MVVPRGQPASSGPSPSPPLRHLRVMRRVRGVLGQIRYDVPMNISDTKPAGAIELPASMEPGALAPSSPTGQAAPSAIESPEAACGELASPDAITATQTTLARATDEGDPVILVVHASVGSGHRSAAYAIAEAIQNAGERARADAAGPALPAGLDPALAARARKVLDVNKSERHIRGGLATREKYLHQKGIV